MPNPSLNQVTQVVLRYSAKASWNFTDTAPCQAATARPFGRHEPRPESQNSSRQPLPDIPIKPVMYLPVQKRMGKERFPSLCLSLLLAEDPSVALGGTHLRTARRTTAHQSVTLPGVEGMPVEFEVANVWLGDVWTSPGHEPEKLTGKLRADLSCDVIVPSEVVQRWFDRDGKLGARVNENLLEFRWKIPGGRLKGVDSGTSTNRIFLYRRKVMVFIPGVFGSQVQVQTADGQVYGFPDFMIDDAAPMTPQESLGKAVGSLLRIKKQQIGVLECDARGVPLAEPREPKLLMLRPLKFRKENVYETFVQLREARLRRMSNVPEEFILFELHIFPYDWRGDLTLTSVNQLQKLQQLQDSIRKHRPDTDDEIAVAGHSTGGVIIRRILAEPEAEGLISNAFFMNVPFRGAAKPMSVLLTGRDPFGGDPMIPIVLPESLQSIGFTAPVVYHLSTTNHYVQPPGGKRRRFVEITAEGFETHAGMDAEDLKRAWIRLACETRYIGPRRIVPDGQVVETNLRNALALEADNWARVWNAHLARMRAADVFNDVVSAKLKAQLEKEIRELRLERSAAARTMELAWNEELAAMARDFHAISENAAASGKWKDKAYIFYSLSVDKTTIGVRGERVGKPEKYLQLKDLLRAVGHPATAAADADKRELVPEPRPILESVIQYEHWTNQGSAYVRTHYRLEAIQGSLHGDGTVPIRSLLGFGGEARVFRRLLLSNWPGWEDIASDSNIVEARRKELEQQTYRGRKVALERPCWSGTRACAEPPVGLGSHC